MAGKMMYPTGSRPSVADLVETSGRKLRTFTCLVCKRKKEHRPRGGYLPQVCNECKAKKGPRTYICHSCCKQKEFPFSNGRPPLVCPDCKEKERRERPLYRTFICPTCNQEKLATLGGFLPLRCSDCKAEARRRPSLQAIGRPVMMAPRRRGNIA